MKKKDVTIADKFPPGTIVQITTLNGSIYNVKINSYDKDGDLYGDYILKSCLVGGIKHINPNPGIRLNGCFYQKGNKNIKKLPFKKLS